MVLKPAYASGRAAFTSYINFTLQQIKKTVQLLGENLKRKIKKESNNIRDKVLKYSLCSFVHWIQSNHSSLSFHILVKIQRPMIAAATNE